MKPIILIGHRHSCHLQGDGKVITGSPSATVNGRSIARVGDEVSCGAVIETGSLSFRLADRLV